MGHLLLAAPHKSSGKTTISFGLCAALRGQGRTVQPFKKGPDYIDPMWLGRAAGRPCHNLDFYTQSAEEILASFATHSQGADLALIEGNMGLFDSLDVEGTGSNAALAKLLQAPVVLVVDVRGATRSIVPLLLGFQQFDKELRIGGVILNKVGGARHEHRLREVISHYTDLPILGAIHRNPALAIEERHLGLIPSNETTAADAILEQVAATVAAQVDLDKLQALAEEAPRPLLPQPPAGPAPTPKEPVRIGIARDEAFGFYYPGDLEQLRLAGAELVEFDTLQDNALPFVDGIFIGGGFPETRMEALEANRPLRQALREAIEAGLPCYAECGGLMYLCRTLRWGERRAEMVGIIPADVVMHDKPVGRGYVRLRETGRHPWDESASWEFNAHEFHYSSLENVGEGVQFAYEVLRGSGVDGRHDGIVYRNLLANYVHLRDVESHHWTRRFIDFVRRVRNAGAAANPRPFTPLRS